MFVNRMQLVNNPDWVFFPNWTDGKDHYRQVSSKGNGHAVFEQGASFGMLHYDEHNALDFPLGTYRHLRKWVSNKTGISEGLIDLGAAYFLLRYLGR